MNNGGCNRNLQEWDEEQVYKTLMAYKPSNVNSFTTMTLISYWINKKIDHLRPESAQWKTKINLSLYG